MNDHAPDNLFRKFNNKNRYNFHLSVYLKKLIKDIAKELKQESFG
jgi:hypothetical protein